MRRGADERPVELLGKPVEGSETVPRRLITELVGQPCEAVDREQVRPQSRWQQA